MTSGIFETVDPNKVWVNRAGRQRREVKNVEDLANSISRVGLIHPPVIRHTFELVVGERRWTAIKSLGWTSMPIQYIEDLSESELRAVELEENVGRVDLSWQEICSSVLEYHDLKVATEPNWNNQKSADALGINIQTFYNRTNIAKEILAGNKVVAEAPKYSTAKNIVDRKNERARTSEIASIASKQEDAPIIQADFIEWAKTYSGPKFNLIHCDFPYGVNADKMDQGSAADHGGYSDTKELYIELLTTLTAKQDNFIDPSAHLIFWFSMDYYTATKQVLETAGWRLDGRLLIWHKSDGTSILPDPARGPRWTYETAFFGSRGDRKIVRATTNLISHPATSKYHMSEKPVGVLQHWFRMVCDEYSSVLDPTCGSGNALVAGGSFGAASVLGIERDGEFCERARENWRGFKAGDESGG